MKANIANKIRSNLLVIIDKELKSKQIQSFFKLNDQTIKESVHIEFNEIFSCKQDISLNEDISSSIISTNNDAISQYSQNTSLTSHMDNTQLASPFSLNSVDQLKQNLVKLKSFCVSLKSSQPLERPKSKRRKKPSKTNKVNTNLLQEFKENIKYKHRGSFAYVNHQRVLSHIPFQLNKA